MPSLWDYLSSTERRWRENTPLGVNCARCGAYLATEADFSKHFIAAYGPSYPNTGYCPENPRFKK